MHCADITLDVQDAAALRAALDPEQGPDGTTTRWSTESGRLTAHLEADDLSALRAAIQGALRLADAAARALARPGDGNG